MSDKLVSILIPVYNREKLVEETARSAMNQTYENIEIIVVDNKSTDNTWQVLERLAKEDKRIKIFQNKENIGPVRNWKRCIDEASGEYGKILWSDDLIAPYFLEKTVPFLDNPDVGFVFTQTELFCDNSDFKSILYSIGNTGIYESLEYINGLASQGRMNNNLYPTSPGVALFRLQDLKKNLLVDIPNKVNSDFAMHAIGNDLLIYLLTANQYKKFAFVNEKLLLGRSHEGSISVQSGVGKLGLHYNLAFAYFAENYMPDIIEKLNANILATIEVFNEEAEKYNLNRIENFYLTNTNFEIDINQYHLAKEKLEFEKTYENENIRDRLTSDKTKNMISHIASMWRKIAIYGAGFHGIGLYNTYHDILSNKVCCFLDDDPKDAEFMGKPIIKPQDIPDDVDLVIISPQSKKAYENMKEKVNSKKAIWLRDLVF